MHSLFRHFTPPSGFFEQRTDTHTWWFKDSLLAETLKALEHIEQGTAPGQRGGRGTVQRVALGDQGHAIVRSYKRGGFVRHFVHDLYWDRPLRPFAELMCIATARERGGSTVEVLGAGVEHVAFGFYRGTLITREAVGFLNWWDWLQTHPAAEERQLVTQDAVQAITHMHDAGIYHADLNLTNILIRLESGQPETLIIDFDRARIFATPLPSFRRKRTLSRLLRSMKKLDPDGRVLPFAERGVFLDD